jgi:hypothetical protein
MVALAVVGAACGSNAASEKTSSAPAAIPYHSTRTMVACDSSAIAESKTVTTTDIQIPRPGAVLLTVPAKVDVTSTFGTRLWVEPMADACQIGHQVRVGSQLQADVLVMRTTPDTSLVTYVPADSNRPAADYAVVIGNSASG